MRYRRRCTTAVDDERGKTERQHHLLLGDLVRVEREKTKRKRLHVEKKQGGPVQEEICREEEELGKRRELTKAFFSVRRSGVQEGTTSRTHT